MLVDCLLIDSVANSQSKSIESCIYMRRNIVLRYTCRTRNATFTFPDDIKFSITQTFVLNFFRQWKVYKFVRNS